MGVPDMEMSLAHAHTQNPGLLLFIHRDWTHGQMLMQISAFESRYKNIGPQCKIIPNVPRKRHRPK